MLVYFKDKHGEIVKINVIPKQAIGEIVQNIEDLGSIKRVRINKLHYFVNVVKILKKFC